MSKKILIVDDEPGISGAFRKQLEIIGGFEVVVANGGKECLENLAKDKGQKFDVVLLDLVMPEVDGIAVLEELKKNPQNYNAADIIVLTNVSSEDTKKEVASFNVKAFLVKTEVHPNELIDMINKV